MLTYVFEHTDYQKLLLDFAKTVGAEVIDHRMNFPPGIANGYMQYEILPNGLHAVISSYTINKDVYFKRAQAEKEFYVLRFNEITVADNLVIEIGPDKLRTSGPVVSTAFLSSYLFDLGYLGKKGSTLRGVNVLLTKEWVARYLGISNEDEVLQKYVAMKADSFNIEPLDSEYKRLMTEVIDAPADSLLRMTVIENRIMLMIERFFTRLYDKMLHPKTRLSLGKNDIDRVMQIESLLVKDVFQQPPPISQLAKMVMVSQSKLKKDFKAVFGFPIFEYFQRTRMHTAREMLATGNHTVKQVAMELGYNNMSNFTIAFKKEFGMLPSEMLN